MRKQLAIKHAGTSEAVIAAIECMQVPAGAAAVHAALNGAAGAFQSSHLSAMNYKLAAGPRAAHS